MPGPLAAPIIGAVGSLLGGLFGRKKAISAGDNAFSHVGGIMRAASTYGFNPLTLLGAVSPMGGTPADNSAFGQGIANAAMIVADDLSSRQADQAKLNAYQTQNQRLQRRLDTVSVRSPVPGLYGGVRQPSDPEVYGNGAGQNTAGLAPSGRGDGASPRLVGQSVSDRPDADLEAKIALRDSYVPAVPVSQSDQGVAPPQLPLLFLGREFKTRSRSSDAEAFEARYGEVGAEAAGAAIFADDLAYNTAYWRNQKVARYTKNLWLAYAPYRIAQRQGFDAGATPFWATPDYMRMVGGH